ncbi:MAG: hypothetical protein QW416_08495 [Candidatus Nitrosocaldaceae archaeon]
MIILALNEKILLEEDSTITIKYKPKGVEKGKGIFYITTLRLVFEDKKKGIMMQVSPKELQAYRINKGLIGKGKLALDVEKTNILATVEIEVKDLKEAEKALKRFLEREEREEFMPIGEKKEYEELEFPLYEGEQVIKLIHDVDVEHYLFDELKGVDKKAKLVLTDRHARVITKNGLDSLIDDQSIHKVMNNIVEVYTPNPAGKRDILDYRLTFSNNEDARFYSNHLKNHEKYIKENVRKYGKDYWNLRQDRVAIVKTEGYDDLIIKEIAKK